MKDRGRARRVLTGSKQSDPCDEVACLSWSDDGRSVFYGCRDGAGMWWRKLDAE